MYWGSNFWNIRCIFACKIKFADVTLAKAVKGGAVFGVGGGMPLVAFERVLLYHRPHRAYGHRRDTDNRQRLRGKHRWRCFYLWDSMPFIRVLIAVADKVFYDRSLTYRLSVVHESRLRCAAFLRCRISQTRLSGTGQCHYKSKEYNLCSFNQWPSANAGCMNNPSKVIPMRFMTFSEGMLGTAVKE